MLERRLGRWLAWAKDHYCEWPGPRPNLVLLHPSSGYGRMCDVEGNYALQMENPAGLAEALAGFAAQAARD